MRDTTEARAEVDQLAEAAIAALRAPSIFNTQPWRWQLVGSTALLSVAPERQLAQLDPDARMLLVSCGTALHHAVVALGSAGYRAEVDRLPNPDRPELVARLRRGEPAEMDGQFAEQYRAIYVRRTDRRPFGDVPPTPGDLAALRSAAERHGVHLHILGEDAVPAFAAAVAHAADVEHTEPLVREEIAAWSDRPTAARDGVSQRTTVDDDRRTIPTRDFISSKHAALPPGTGTDRGTVYAVLFTDGDERQDWLAAGEALSDVWLTLTGRGLAASPISEVIEVDAARQALRRLLAGVGYPAIALRIGVPVDPHDVPPPSIRRSGADVVGPPDES
jgi:nitroreductase